MFVFLSPCRATAEHGGINHSRLPMYKLSYSLSFVHTIMNYLHFRLIYFNLIPETPTIRRIILYINFYGVTDTIYTF